jgi:Putative Actinobacterial Holin-X, holin superfamily III
MPIRETDGNGQRSPGLGAAVKQVAEHASSLARLEMQLAAAELGRKAKALGLAIGLAVGAVLFILFSLGFALAGIAAAIATTLPIWASILLVAAGTLLLALGLAALALVSFKKGSPPVPEQAIEEAKKTTEVIKPSGH